MSDIKTNIIDLGLWIDKKEKKKKRETRKAILFQANWTPFKFRYSSNSNSILWKKLKISSHMWKHVFKRKNDKSIFKPEIMFIKKLTKRYK